MICNIPPKIDCLKDNSNSKKDANIKPNNKTNIKQPLVARISLWTTRTTGNRAANSNNNYNSDSDNDDDDENHRNDDDDESSSELELDTELDENAQLEKRLNDANLPEYVRKVVAKELQKLRRTPSFMSDYAITRSYLELIADLPWNERTPEHIDLKKCRRDLDNDHYGMQKLKERVLQYLAVRKLRQGTSATQAAGSRRSNQPILMFVGPPGTGKTSIAQSIANSLGRKFQRISLGGVADQSAIRGHRRTYIASMPGLIIQGLKQAGVKNPVFLLDEVDKLTAGSQGDPSGALLEVLDPEQNHTFTDHYLNLPFDLSEVLFIATANSAFYIPDALYDRMEVIHIQGYTHDEKFSIARKHLVPKQVIENGLKANMIVIKDEAIHKVITNYAREAGVRTLERRIATICRVVAVEIVEKSQQQVAIDQQRQQSPVVATPFNNSKIVVDAESLEKYLGPVVYDRDEGIRANVPGVAIGLAWTASGGEITFVEAEIMRGMNNNNNRATGGEGGLVLTGQLGSVMRESATLALNWLRANIHLYEWPQSSTMATSSSQHTRVFGRDLIENTVHIHFPAGGVGKDGPSAGVTIVVALMSLCSNLSIVPDLAMTGEITLRGVVLKIGGVKSKVLAAHRAGIKEVILPVRNETDVLNDVPVGIREKIKFHFVSTIEDVIRIAFNNQLLPKSSTATTATKQVVPLHSSSGLTSKL